MLQKVGAKSNLADACSLLELTYQHLGDLLNSKKYFAEAIRLFDEMQVPKQVETVQKTIKYFEHEQEAS